MELIQPVKRGAALMAEISETRVERGQVAIWWLGQSGYAIRTRSAMFYIDLYLSEQLTRKYANTEKPHIRMTEAPLHGGDITNADFVFASHKHSDHLDLETVAALLAASPNARLILPMAVMDYAVQHGPLDSERLIPVGHDDHALVFELSYPTLTITAIPSAHPGFDHSDAFGYPFLGFIIEVDGVTLYHSGDTLAYDGLAERVRAFQPDLVFLPINGTTPRLNALGTPPNMSAGDAVGLAAAIGDPLVIPHHYDMFTFNTIPVSDFTQLAQARGVRHRVLQAGERFLFSASGVGETA